MAIEIALSSGDMAWVEQIAGRRQNEAVQAGRPDRHGFNGRDGYALHRLGAAGELAVARALEVPWDATVNTFRAPDLGGIFQVRTRSEHWHDLIVRSEDKDEEIFILVTGRPPDLVVHGWIVGKDAKQHQWKNDYGGRPTAYFVPKAALQQLN
jgi:hypothetical protein